MEKKVKEIAIKHIAECNRLIRNAMIILTTFFFVLDIGLFIYYNILAGALTEAELLARILPSTVTNVIVLALCFLTIGIGKLSESVRKYFYMTGLVVMITATVAPLKPFFCVSFLIPVIISSLYESKKFCRVVSVEAIIADLFVAAYSYVNLFMRQRRMDPSFSPQSANYAETMDYIYGIVLQELICAFIRLFGHNCG